MTIFNIRHIKISYPLLTSVMLHMTLIIIIGLTFDFSPPNTALGNTKEQALSSYLFDDNFIQTTTTTEKNLAKSANKIVATKEIIQKNTRAITINNNISTQKNTSASTRHSKKSRGEQTEELIALLHTAIQNQQHYPPNAIQMQREGRITLAFTLYKNGTISDLRVVKSSQTNSLDDAALAAVRDAAPFQAVKKYMQEPQEYSIDVVFELT
jgi:TonB family protein